MGRWMVEMIGPGPATGEWVPIASKQKEKGVATFEWRLREKESPFATTNGRWIFVGRQAEFVWRINRWRFVGDKVSLTFQKDDEIVAKRFFSEGADLFKIAANSAVAKARMKEIEATFSGEKRLETKPSSAASAKEDLELQLADGKEEAESDLSHRFGKNGGAKKSKEMSIALDRPNLGKELEITLDRPDLGKELEITLDKPKEGKSFAIGVEAEPVGDEIEANLGKTRKSKMLQAALGRAPSASDLEVDLDDMDTVANKLGLRSQDVKKKKGLLGGIDSKNKANGDDELGAEDLDGQLEGAGSLGNGKKRKNGKDDSIGSLDENNGLSLDDGIEGADSASAPADELSARKRNGSQSGQALARQKAERVVEEEDFDTGVDAFKPVGLISTLQGKPAEVQESNELRLQLRVEDGDFKKGERLKFAVVTENLRPAATISAFCKVLTSEWSGEGKDFRVEIELDAETAKSWMQILHAVASRQMNILRFLRMAKGG
jgi:hypothetical protein